MKKESEREYINDLIRHTEESIRFFSNEMKPERERSVCAAFLRCLGMKFSPIDIFAYEYDPPDVIFDSARFEIIELYDDRRKRLDEYKKKLAELKNAKTLEDTLIPYHSPQRISYQEIYERILIALNGKSTRYGSKFCSGLDALVYVGLPNRFLDTKSSVPDWKEMATQGWRSVSFVIPPVSHVIFCRGNSPRFIKSFLGQTKAEWKDPDGFFDLE